MEKNIFYPFAHNLALMSHTGIGHNVVFEIKVELALIANDEFAEVDHVFAKHLAGVHGQGRGEVGVTNDAYAMPYHGLVVNGALAVAPGGGGQVYNHRPGLHFLHGFIGNEDGRFSTRYLSRGNDDV